MAHGVFNKFQGDSGGGVTASVGDRSYLMGVVSHGTSCYDLLSGTPPGAQVNAQNLFSKLMAKL